MFKPFLKTSVKQCMKNHFLYIYLVTLYYTNSEKILMKN